VSTDLVKFREQRFSAPFKKAVVVTLLRQLRNHPKKLSNEGFEVTAVGFAIGNDDDLVIRCQGPQPDNAKLTKTQHKVSSIVCQILPSISVHVALEKGEQLTFGLLNVRVKFFSHQPYLHLSLTYESSESE
jgi:hypothetical protein